MEGKKRKGMTHGEETNDELKNAFRNVPAMLSRREERL